MSQKARKTDHWEQIKALDKRALALLASGRGLTLDEAYKLAHDEAAVEKALQRELYT